MNKAEISLILPGFAPILEQEINKNLIPRSLQQIITQSNFETHELGLERLLLNLFSNNAIDNDDLPVLDIWGINDGVVKADPCYLHADRDKLILFSGDLGLSEQESTALIAEIQPLLTDFKLELRQQNKDNWYISSPDKELNATFTALPDVAGKGIDMCLPKGPDRQHWVRLWNEIQMQLHNAEINQQRMREHKLPINSIWFWGRGTFSPKQQAYTHAYGSLPILKQLASVGNCEFSENLDLKTIPVNDERSLYLLKPLDTDANIQQQLNSSEDDFFKPVWQWINKKKINQLSLHIPEFGTYTLRPKKTWKFWRC